MLYSAASLIVSAAFKWIGTWILFFSIICLLSYNWLDDVCGGVFCLSVSNSFCIDRKLCASPPFKFSITSLRSSLKSECGERQVYLPFNCNHTLSYQFLYLFSKKLNFFKLFWFSKELLSVFTNTVGILTQNLITFLKIFENYFSVQKLHKKKPLSKALQKRPDSGLSIPAPKWKV